MRAAGPGAARRDGGSASVEFLGFLPILLLIALAGVQLGLLAYTASQAGTAARTAARTDDPNAGRESVSNWLNPHINMSPGPGQVTATVTVDVPSVLPGIDFLDPVVRRATMPQDSQD